MSLPRLAICGISLEASTYSPALTRRSDFVRQAGEDIFEYYPFLAAGGTLRAAAEWVPLVRYRAIPGGAIPYADYCEMRAEMVAALAEAMPVAGVLFDIHGAASVVGLDDPEADLVRALREVTGPEVIFSSGMDLHGNVSRELFELVDLLTCYRMAPHEDWLETKERAAVNLVQWVRDYGVQRPAAAWLPVPILLPGEQTSTRLEPAAGLYQQVAEIAALEGIWDAGLWVGYPWADEPRNRAAIVVFGVDAEVCERECRALGQALWGARGLFDFVAPTGSLADCLEAAVASEARPFFISDSGDNPTAGGAGDATSSLAELVALPPGGPDIIYASIPDAAAVALAVSAGVGNAVQVQVGAHVDSGACGPVSLHAVVEHIATTDPVAGIEVVLRSGRVRCIVTQRRKPYHLVDDFMRNGLSLARAEIVVVKIGYLEPELYAAAADWRLALTPGGVDQNLQRLGHRRVVRPMFPLDVTAAPGGSFTPEFAPVVREFQR